MPTSNATDLLVKLSSDPALRQRFQADPGAVLDEAGVEGEDREILLSGDPGRLQGYLASNDAPPGCFLMFAADDTTEP
jgi:hypothetical protein